mmetsp:Transcript_18365/g.50375  ORF Transcript_18365/g.50375 Transcript_18365/m.50375 type:complete len:416 (+) Transcript_18365:108-1355(+)
MPSPTEPGATTGAPDGAEAASSNLASGGARLPQLDTSATPVSKLASPDWPPPPSPSHPGWNSAASVGGTSRHGSSIYGNSMAEARNLAELWALRAEIDREKLRSVASYPFFGHPMRFQDEHSALQITDDGRFCFSTMDAEATDTSDLAAGEDANAGRKVLTYEGVFVAPNFDDAMLDQAVFFSSSDVEVASVEGKALVRHELLGTRIVNLQRGHFRFAITVTPLYEPTDARVQSFGRSLSPGRPPPRCRRLHYVGAGVPWRRRGPPKWRQLVRPSRSEARLGADVDELCRGLRQSPSSSLRLTLKDRLDKSIRMGALQHRSVANLAAQSSGDNSPGRLSFDRKTTPLPKLTSSVSAPQLMAMRVSAMSQSAHIPKMTAPKTKGSQDTSKMTVGDWKEFYRQRAEQVLSAEAKHCF